LRVKETRREFDDCVVAIVANEESTLRVNGRLESDERLVDFLGVDCIARDRNVEAVVPLGRVYSMTACALTIKYLTPATFNSRNSSIQSEFRLIDLMQRRPQASQFPRHSKFLIR